MCIDKKHKNKIKMNLLIHKSIFKISRMQQSVRGGYILSLRCSPHGGCGFHNKPHTDILWWHEKLHAWCFRVRHQPILFIYSFYKWLAYASPSSAGSMVFARCVWTEAYRSDTVDMTSVLSASSLFPSSSTFSLLSLAGSAVVSKWTTSEYWTCGELRPDCVVGGFRVRLA